MKTEDIQWDHTTFDADDQIDTATESGWITGTVQTPRQTKVYQADAIRSLDEIISIDESSIELIDIIENERD